MSYILIISLGPIQDFIASARRCRDLWFGSWLLSDLSKAVAIDIVKQEAQLVFPSPASELVQESDTSVANKIVAILPDGKTPSDVAESARNALHTRLKEHTRKVFNQIDDKEARSSWDPMFNRDMAVKQVEDLIEFLWVAAPIDKDYSTARESAESLLAQRKRTLLWGNVPWETGFGVPKSSLDGQRESALDEAKFLRAKPGEELDPKYVAHLRKTYGIKKNERLCGVGLLKRLGTRPWRSEEHQFMSTPHLATGPLLWRMREEADRVRPAWDAYLEALNKLDAELDKTVAEPHPVLGHYDGKYLLDPYLEEAFDRFDRETRKKKVQCAEAALKHFFKTTKLDKPLPYFAVLLADGDRMGKAIEGRNEHEHRRLSFALDGFAQNAREIVQTAHQGELIYSGGDDVLAFVPLNNVIECARDLAIDFKRRLAEFVDKEGSSPTLSVGIAICHFIEPMGHALELARKAEKRAKEKRRSLAIIVDKRSGPPVEVYGEWDSRIAQQLLEFAKLHRHDEIPDGVAHELLELETLRVGVGDEKTKATLDDLIAKETGRILNRKRAASGTEEVDQDVIRELLKTPGQLAERLLVSGLIAKAKDIAEGKPKPNEEAAKNTEAA